MDILGATEPGICCHAHDASSRRVIFTSNDVRRAAAVAFHNSTRTGSSREGMKFPVDAEEIRQNRSIGRPDRMVVHKPDGVNSQRLVVYSWSRVNRECVTTVSTSRDPGPAELCTTWFPMLPVK